MIRLSALAVIALGACASSRAAVTPLREAAAVANDVATALERGDLAALDRRVDPGARAVGDRAAILRTDAREVAEAVGRYRVAGHAAGSAQARLRVLGPLGTSIALEKESEGWRVDPESLGLVTPTPAAAIEQLALALERLPGDPALALLGGSLRDTVMGAASERAQGLREVLPRVPVALAGWVSLQIDYGHGLYVVLRLDHGSWRVEDFN